MATANLMALARTRDARDRVIASLQDHFARGAMDVEEFERRVSTAHTSESEPDILALLADLPSSPGNGALTVTGATGVARLPQNAIAPARTIRGFMSATTRRGPWDLPRQLTVKGTMSAIVLDLREARLPTGIVDLHVKALMSSVEIIVPPGLAVETDGSAILGTFEDVHRAPAHPDPDAPLLRIHGTAVLAAVEVKMSLPDEGRALQRPAS